MRKKYSLPNLSIYVLLIFIALLFFSPQVQAFTYTVDHAADDGFNGSLRAMINTSNNSPGEDAIILNLGTNATIILGSNLPSITDALVIYGLSGGTRVTINGSFQSINIAAPAIVTINYLIFAKGENNCENAGTLLIDYCIFRESRDAIYNHLGGICQIDNCIFKNNYSDNYNSVILNEGTCSINRSSFSNGGASVKHNVVSDQISSNIVIKNSSFCDNSSIEIIGSPSSLMSDIIMNCAFYNNETEWSGGVIIVRNFSKLFIINSTLSNNPQNPTSGLYRYLVRVEGGSIVSVNNCTLYNNNGYSLSNSGSTLNINNSIIIGSNLSGSLYPDVVGELNSNGHNIIGDASMANIIGGTGDMIGNVAANQLFDLTLAENGGFTKTHALIDCSPAIDAGDAQGAPLQDQRDIDRVGVVDIGAYEAPITKRHSQLFESLAITTGSPYCVDDTPPVISANGANNIKWYEVIGGTAVGTGNSLDLANTSFDFTKAGNHRIYAARFDPSGCESTNESATIVINPLPTVAISGNLHLCGGDPTTLSANGNGLSYLWYPGGETTSFVTVTHTGINRVTTTNAFACKNTGPVQENIDIIALPSIAISGNLSACLGNSITLTASGNGLTYHWTPGDIETNKITLGAAGAYTVTTTNAEECANSISAEVVFLNLPLPTVIVSGNMTFCRGNSTTLTASGGDTYLWQTGTESVTTQIRTFTEMNGDGLQPTIVWVTDGNGCYNSTVIYPNGHLGPILQISTNGHPMTLCGIDTIILTAIGHNGPGQSFSWYNSLNNVINTTSDTYTVTLPGTYTLSVVDANFNCSVSDVLPIVASPIPDFTVSGNMSPCFGNNTTVIAIPIGIQTIQFSWRIGSGLSSQGNTYNWDHRHGQIVHVTAQDYTSGCQTFKDITFTPLDLHPILNVAGNTSPCSGESTILTVSGALGYHWQTFNSLRLEGFDATIEISGSQRGDFFVKGINSDPACFGELLIPVYSVPAVLQLAGNLAICNGSSTVISASGGTTYSWSPGGATTSTISLSPGQRGTYSVSVLDTLGCLETDSIYVREPQFSISPDLTICTGNSAILSAWLDEQSMKHPASYSYLWQMGTSTSPGTSLTVSTTTLQPTPFYINSSQKFGLTIVDNDFGCIYQDSTNITMMVPLPLPPISVSGNLTPCEGAQTILTINGGNPDYLYDWTTGNVVGNNWLITLPPTFANQQLIITLTDKNINCSSSKQDTIYLLPRYFAQPTLLATPDISLCTGTITTLTVQGADNYEWNPSLGLNTNIGSVVILDANNPGIPKTYTVSGTLVNTCNGKAFVNVVVISTPTMSTSGKVIVCIGDSVALNVNGAAMSYSWLPSTGLNTTIGANVMAHSLTSLTSLTYTIIANNAGFCLDTAFIPLEVLSLPTLNIDNQNITISPGSSVTMNVSGGKSYNWFPDENISCTNCPGPLFSPSVTTTYYVITIDSNMCKSMDSILISVIYSNIDVFIPDAFSPNGDGNNEVLYVHCIGYISLSFVILDRWGEEMFKTTDASNGWDGKQNGAVLNSNTFYYVLNVEFKNNVKVFRTGMFTLVK